MSKRRVHLLAPSLEPHDAVSTDVLGMAQVLSEAGYDVRVFAGRHQGLAGGVELLDDAPRKCWSSSDAVLIYHHSMGWPEGEAVLLSTRNRRIVRYHNITPPRFFACFSESHWEACTAGVAATARIAGIRDALFLSDSSFNCEELAVLGAPRARCLTLPPFHPTAALAATPFDQEALRTFHDGRVNILFVGGIKPNKGHEKALRAFAAYRRWANPDCRLIFAGRIDPRLAGYMEALDELIMRLALADHVLFTGAVSPARLRSLYASADLFLSTSEHEGFGVPLVEAMFFRVPILAWGVTAVPETVGDAGMLWDRYDDALFAESMEACIEQRELARFLAEKGAIRYQERYRPEALKARLLAILEQVVEGGLPGRN
jgi:prepilin-type processing-associated H-X9-DG protein